MNRVVASLEISGFILDKESEELFLKVECGELTTADARQLTIDKVEKAKKEHPEKFVTKI